MAASRRVVLNQRALSAMSAALADGLGDWAQDVLGATKPPDATPFGEGLVTTGGYGVWAAGRKVGGGADKPRQARLNRTGITMIMGWGFPARFQETGTIHQPARPFFTPVIMAKIPELAGFMQRAWGRVAARFR
jgi:hypothetical protein